jgi:hypothetical protein
MVVMLLVHNLYRQMTEEMYNVGLNTI